MQTVEFVSKLLPDGHLSCPQDVVRQLRVQKETQIRVVITSLERVMDRRSIVAQTFGTFKDMPTSSDLFAERKKKEAQVARSVSYQSEEKSGGCWNTSGYWSL